MSKNQETVKPVAVSFNIGLPPGEGQYLLLGDNSLVFEARVNEDASITAASFENGTVVPFEVPPERVRGWALCVAVKSVTA